MSSNGLQIKMRSLTEFTRDLVKTEPLKLLTYTINLANLNDSKVFHLTELEAGANIVFASATVTTAGDDDEENLIIGLATASGVAPSVTLLDSDAVGSLPVNYNFLSSAPHIVQADKRHLHAAASGSSSSISGVVKVVLLLA